MTFLRPALTYVGIMRQNQLQPWLNMQRLTAAHRASWRASNNSRIRMRISSGKRPKLALVATGMMTERGRCRPDSASSLLNLLMPLCWRAWKRKLITWEIYRALTRGPGAAAPSDCRRMRSGGERFDLQINKYYIRIITTRGSIRISLPIPPPSTESVPRNEQDCLGLRVF